MAPIYLGEFEYAVLLAILHYYSVTAAGMKALRATHDAFSSLTKGLESILEQP